MVFQRMGFTQLPDLHQALVGSYPTFSPLPYNMAVILCSTFPSSRKPPVRWHASLCSPDFPHDIIMQWILPHGKDNRIRQAKSPNNNRQNQQQKDTSSRTEGVVQE